MGCTHTNTNIKTRSAIDPNKSKHRLPKIKVEPSIKLYCRMSNIDEDEVLELEISDDETFGLRGSPGKKRKVAEEGLDTGILVERTVTLLPNSMITLPPPSVPAKLSFTQYIQSSFSSSSRVNIYRSRIPLVYPETAVSDTPFC